MNDDEALRESIAAAETREQVERLAAEAGVDITEVDGDAAPGRLSDAELENVAGGTVNALLVVVIN